LQSNILGNDEKEGPLYNPEANDKAGFGTNADWTAQGGSAKIINKGNKVDCYKKKQ
jgi:hypothetical protein